MGWHVLLHRRLLHRRLLGIVLRILRLGLGRLGRMHLRHLHMRLRLGLCRGERLVGGGGPKVTSRCMLWVRCYGRFSGGGGRRPGIGCCRRPLRYRPRRRCAARRLVLFDRRWRTGLTIDCHPLYLCRRPGLLRLGGCLNPANWACHRIASPSQHPVGMGPKTRGPHGRVRCRRAQKNLEKSVSNLEKSSQKPKKCYSV